MTKTTSPTNLRHWDALGSTDPAQTKPFSRGVGFKGTAIKPIWTERRLTEHFGPAGIGWGMDKPEFQLVPAGDELMVYCTVALWYADPAVERAYIWGVGGDKVIQKHQRGPFNDDEAFKKAFTDALGNAMKHIGMAADVHMGLFDDSKYVSETKRAFAGVKISPEIAAAAQLESKAYDAASAGSYALRSFWGDLRPDQKRSLKPLLDEHLKAIAEKSDKEQNPAESSPAGAPSGHVQSPLVPSPEGATP